MHRRPVAVSAAFWVLFVVLLVGTDRRAAAQALDLTTFTLEVLPSSGFADPVYDLTPTSATLQDGINPEPSFFYSNENVLGRRIRGFITPSTVGSPDDDFLGIALGFQPGDATMGGQSADADYILIDWKGGDQTADATDGDGLPDFHNLTPAAFAPVGLAASRVTGLPTHDEYWQHTNFPENTLGGLTELARGATRGSSTYPQEPGSSFEIDIIYLPDRLEVRIDGELEIELEGAFPDGRVAFYNSYQSDAPAFSNFQLLPPFPPFELEIDPNTGFARVVAVGEDPVELRSYSLGSADDLLAGPLWSATNLTIRSPDSAEGAAAGERWDTVNDSADQLFEAFLQGGSTLAPGESLVIGQILDPADAANEPELVFDFVSGAPGATGDSGADFAAPIVYKSFSVSPGLYGDYNSDGSVDAADYTLWRSGAAAITGQAGYDLWAANYGRIAPASAAAVPEPLAFTLASIATIALVARRR